MKNQEPQIWYRVHNLSIEKVLATQISAKTLKRTDKRRPDAIDSEYGHYRPTFEQAKLAMIAKAEQARNDASNQLLEAEEDLALAKRYSEDRVRDCTKEFKL